MSSLCYNQPQAESNTVSSSRSSEPASLFAILEDSTSTSDVDPHSQPSPSPSSGTSTSGSSDRFADAPFDGMITSSSHGLNHITSVHETPSHINVNAIEWSASHYRRKALAEELLKKDERRRHRRQRREQSNSGGGFGSMSSSSSNNFNSHHHRVPDLIGGASIHGRNESCASTISASSVSTLGATASHSAPNLARIDAGRKWFEDDNDLVTIRTHKLTNVRKTPSPLLAPIPLLDPEAFSLDVYDKQGVPGSSGPRRFKLGLGRRGSEGTNIFGHGNNPSNYYAASSESTALSTAAGGFGSTAKPRRGRRPSFILRDVASNSAPASHTLAYTQATNDHDMKDVLEEILKMEEAFTLDSSANNHIEETKPATRNAGLVPATPVAGMERARELNMNPPPAPLRTSNSYPQGLQDTPLNSSASDDTNLPYMENTPGLTRTPGHFPSRSLNSLLLPPKDYPEGNWQLSPGSGHPTKIEHDNRGSGGSVSLSRSHRHLRGLSNGQDVMDALMRSSHSPNPDSCNAPSQSRVSSWRSSRELSPDSQAKGHRIRRSLTFENTPTGPKFPSGVILGSTNSNNGNGTSDGKATTPRPHNSQSMNGFQTSDESDCGGGLSSGWARKQKARKVLDDSVTRFQFPLNSAASKSDTCEQFDVPTSIVIDEPRQDTMPDEASSLGLLGLPRTGLTLDTSDLPTPTWEKMQFDRTPTESSHPFGLSAQPPSAYLTPSHRSGHKLSDGGSLQPSLLPSTPVNEAQGPALGEALGGWEDVDQDMES